MWLIDSSVGRKFIMGISGAFLVLFLLFHSIMNVVVIFSPEAYNAICAFLGANWYAVLGTLVLAAGVVVHMLYGVLLSIQNLRARGRERYAVTTRQEGVAWSSKNMLVLGIVILAFLVLHLIQFWAKMQLVELTGMGGHEAHELAANGAYWIQYYFSKPIYCIVYIVALVALWFHLTHGVWSAMQSMGLNNKTWLPRLKVIGNVVSTVVVLLFISIPVYYLIITIFGL
ncbi:succinate dehydrogenase/fumarate reductase cytochrome b subunit [Paludibacter sp. 221]|uniref:succinate dehydrogenase cytochrome b subunit n=1 Tax=Paludibacter sp. 221 TaxID=2302939 RepID=UPI0013D475AA|nr:succinate dehydrogenase cytochrome b subunit [Paludibacter sp. 221]NDV47064.1 succinate dehydrogenase/fumarate reductase cytochrome b subunit [Paludibacter sp. 221]